MTEMKIRQRKRIADLEKENSSEKEKKSTRKRKKPTKNYYFTQKVQDEIVKYQKTDCKKEKDLIFKKHISPAFNDLVQSLISVYKFKATNEDINHLKSDCVAFLFETIYKWSPEKGKKAFSYFNVVAKNYLTIHTRRMLKNSNRSVYLDDISSLNSADKAFIFDKEYIDGDEVLRLSTEKYERILEIVNFIGEKLTDDRDVRCYYAIKTLFESIEDIEFFNKRAIFVYLREISGLNSTELSSSLSNMRKIFKKNVGFDKKFNIFDLG
jgi:hypothetical protein